MSSIFVKFQCDDVILVRPVRQNVRVYKRCVRAVLSTLHDIRSPKLVIDVVSAVSLVQSQRHRLLWYVKRINLDLVVAFVIDDYRQVADRIMTRPDDDAREYI